MNDAWLSLAEFKDEVVPSQVRSVPFAGFTASIRGTKQHKFRREWKQLLNEWLEKGGFQERVK